MEKQLDLNLLRVFCAVVETGSMSEAAQSLDMNQSAVSLAMQKLKVTLDTELFVRKSRGVEPTTTAKALYHKVSTDLLSINRAVSSLVTFEPMQSKRTFSVSCPEFSHTVLLKQLFYPANPELQIHLYNQPESSESLIQQLLDREHDVFIDVDVPDHPSIVAQQLSQDRSCVIARKEHPRLTGDRISLEQFLNEPYVKLARTRNKLAGISWLTKAQMHQLNVVSHTNSLFESMVTVSQSDLISTLPITMAQHYQQLLGLQTYELPFSGDNINIYMLWHKANSADPGHQWLRERIALIYQN
ncbi:LysR family transcriptional regulator [Vibrio sp. WXL103]|uniref:LysR family transcriptional regulator n=1 Tax=unclassified Vibrio TaxID=2614977 RepID=UPI003EC83B33